MNKPSLYVLLLMLLGFQATAYGAIVLSIEAGSFQQNSGTQVLRVFARTNANDSLTALATDITLEAGIYSAVPGTFMEVGQIGFGSTGASDFFRNSDTDASLTLEFNMPANPPDFDQPFPLLAGELATIAFDVNGLSPGTYAINFSNSFAIDSAANFIDVIEGNGTFTITAVPEPSTFFMLGLTATGLCAYRRRQNASRKLQGDAV